MTTATWVVNVILLLLPRPVAQAMIDAGARMYACVEWDAAGQAHPSSACTGPEPVFILPRADRVAWFGPK